MLKKWLILIFLLIFIIVGCGKVISQTTDLPDNNTSEIVAPEQETLTPSSMAGFAQAILSATVILGEQAGNPGTIVSTQPFQVNRAGTFSLMGVSDGYPYWIYETRTRVINGITETVQSQYCYYNLSGQRFDHVRAANEPFSFIERYLDITASGYQAHFHEKIVYSGQNTTLTVFPGSTYNNSMTFNGISMLIGTRNISYSLGTRNGSGTMQVTYSNMSGDLAINILNDVYSVDGYLNKNNKRAVHLVIQNNNQPTMTFVVNKANASQYYYTELNLLSADLISNVYVEIMDSSAYTTNLLLYQLSNVTINAAAGQAPWFNSASSYILRINDCDHISISGLNFENTANNSSYNYVYISLTSYVNLNNCRFRKTLNRTSNFMRIENVDHINIKNSLFEYLAGNKKCTGILLYTANIDQNILLQGNTYNGLNYGIYFNVGSAGNPAVTVDTSSFQNNQYGIYRTNTGYAFNNINNIFSGNTTNIR